MPVVMVATSSWRSPSAPGNSTSGISAHSSASSAALRVARCKACGDAVRQGGPRRLRHQTRVPQAATRMIARHHPTRNGRGPTGQNAAATMSTFSRLASIVSGVSRSTACSWRARNPAATGSAAS